MLAFNNSDPLKAPTGSPSHISKEPIPDRGEIRALEQFKIRSKADYDSNVYGMQADYRQQTPSQGQIQGQPSFMEDDYEQYKEMSLSQE